jgi:hypothetical protein
MAVTPKDHTGEIELRPDGWARFEATVDAALKSAPKHKAAKSEKASQKRSALRPHRKPVSKDV